MQFTASQLLTLIREAVREELRPILERKDGEFYTVEEAAAKLKVHPQHIYRMARAGKLRAEKVGKFWRVRIS